MAFLQGLSDELPPAWDDINKPSSRTPAAASKAKPLLAAKPIRRGLGPMQEDEDEDMFPEFTANNDDLDLDVEKSGEPDGGSKQASAPAPDAEEDASEDSQPPPPAKAGAGKPPLPPKKLPSKKEPKDTPPMFLPDTGLSLFEPPQEEPLAAFSDGAAGGAPAQAAAAAAEQRDSETEAPDGAGSMDAEPPQQEQQQEEEQQRQEEEPAQPSQELPVDSAPGGDAHMEESVADAPEAELEVAAKEEEEEQDEEQQDEEQQGSGCLAAAATSPAAAAKAEATAAKPLEQSPAMVAAAASNPPAPYAAKAPEQEPKPAAAPPAAAPIQQPTQLPPSNPLAGPMQRGSVLQARAAKTAAVAGLPVAAPAAAHALAAKPAMGLAAKPAQPLAVSPLGQAQRPLALKGPGPSLLGKPPTGQAKEVAAQGLGMAKILQRAGDASKANMARPAGTLPTFMRGPAPGASAPAGGLAKAAALGGKPSLSNALEAHATPAGSLPRLAPALAAGMQGTPLVAAKHHLPLVKQQAKATPVPFTPNPGGEAAGPSTAAPGPSAAAIPAVPVEDDDLLSWQPDASVLQYHVHHIELEDSMLESRAPWAQQQLMGLDQINSSTERLRRQLQDMHVTALMVTASQAFMDNPLQAARLASLKRKADSILEAHHAYQPLIFNYPAEPDLSAAASSDTDPPGAGPAADPLGAAGEGSGDTHGAAADAPPPGGEQEGEGEEEWQEQQEGDVEMEDGRGEASALVEEAIRRALSVDS